MTLGVTATKKADFRSRDYGDPGRENEARTRPCRCLGPCFAGGGNLGEAVAESAQLTREVDGGVVALPWLLGETALDHPAERRRYAGIELGERLGLVLENRRERLRRRLGLKRAAPGEQLVERQPERKLVGAEVDGAAARLLRAHVGHGADDDAGLREGDVEGAGGAV